MKILYAAINISWLMIQAAMLILLFYLFAFSIFAIDDLMTRAGSGDITPAAQGSEPSGFERETVRIYHQPD